MKKIIIDTDPGVDDVLAIMLAVRSGMFDIKAITTVMGNSTIENTTRNAQFVLDLLNNKNIPLYSGSSQPRGGNWIKSVVMGNSGLGGLTPNNSFDLTGNAVEKIIEIIEDNPDEISIVAVGPLTNIAKAIETNPIVMQRVKEIIIMGGAIRVAGNKSRVGEFNIFSDPMAAKVVFDFPVSKVLIPLDICNTVELSDQDFNKIRGPLKEPILTIVGEYMKKLEMNETGKRIALVYDALAVYYLLNPQVYSTENLDVRVETKGELTSGMTVVDFRMVGKKENNFKVAFSMNSSIFVEDFIRILSNPMEKTQ